MDWGRYPGAESGCFTLNPFCFGPGELRSDYPNRSEFDRAWIDGFNFPWIDGFDLPELDGFDHPWNHGSDYL